MDVPFEKLSKGSFESREHHLGPSIENNFRHKRDTEVD